MSEMQGQGIVIPPFQPSNSPDSLPPNQPQQVDLSEFSDFAQGILGAIPQEDLPAVAKHFKTWDGNVTKKFQEIHDQYKPYKELGDIDSIRQAVQYSEFMQNDPVGFIKMLTGAMEEAGMSLDDLGLNSNNEPVGGSTGGFDPEIEQRFSNYEKMLNGMANKMDQFINSFTEQQQNAQLDKVIQEMHNKHGDFNDDYFLLQLEKGKSPDEAIQEWNKLIGKYGNQHKPAPVLPPTNGAVRQDQVDPSRFSKKDRLAFGLQILNANRD